MSQAPAASPRWFVRWPAALLFSTLATVPFLFVTIPPLTDVPGHMGRFAVQIAPAGDQLFRYYSFHWSLTLNLASDLVVQLLHPWFALVPLTWAICVAAAFLTTLGIVAVARISNPRGAAALPWAFLFVFNWPFLWGFINFSLTFALALLAFAAWMALERRRWWRALLFVPISPLLLVGHGVAGFVGLGLIVSYSLGAAAGRAHGRLPALGQTALSLLPPIASALATIVVWKAVGTRDEGLTIWLLGRKTEAVLMMLRDQDQVLDVGSVGACALIALAGWRWGARLKGGAAAAVLFVTVSFLATPSLISGSDRIDTRLAPIIPMLFFAMQDWSGVRVDRRRAATVIGVILLAIRMGVTTSSFVEYDRRYAKELTALSHVPPGVRILNLSMVDCPEVAWRSERLEHLSNLATSFRGAWVNSHWSIAGLQLLGLRYVPSPDYARDPSHLVWPARCIDFRRPFSRRDRHSLAETMPKLPLDKVDYLWLIDTHLGPGEQDRRLRLVWADDISALYAIDRPPLRSKP